MFGNFGTANQSDARRGCGAQKGKRRESGRGARCLEEEEEEEEVLRETADWLKPCQHICVGPGRTRIGQRQIIGSRCWKSFGVPAAFAGSIQKKHVPFFFSPLDSRTPALRSACKSFASPQSVEPGGLALGRRSPRFVRRGRRHLRRSSNFARFAISQI